MTKKRSYDEVSVIRSLRKKASINIVSRGTSNFIEVARNAQDVGNGSWGKIDYLVKVHGYKLYRPENVSKRYIPLATEEEAAAVTTKRNKINIATMTKNAMKGALRKH